MLLLLTVAHSSHVRVWTVATVREGQMVPYQRQLTCLLEVRSGGEDVRCEEGKVDVTLLAEMCEREDAVQLRE